MGLFARYLSLWVALCIVAGISLGHAFPSVFTSWLTWEVQRINLPVALLVWLMIIPMLLKVDFSQLAGVRRQARGIGVTLLVNWAIKPFSMALLGWLFVPAHIRCMVAGRRARRLHRWFDSARSSAVHGDGVRMVAAVRRRTITSHSHRSH